VSYIERHAGKTYFLFCALTLAHRARCAAAIRARAAALIVRGPLRRPVEFPGPVPFRNALARCSLPICSSMDWIICSTLMPGCNNMLHSTCFIKVAQIGALGKLGLGWDAVVASVFAFGR